MKSKYQIVAAVFAVGLTFAFSSSRATAAGNCQKTVTVAVDSCEESMQRAERSLSRLVVQKASETCQASLQKCQRTCATNSITDQNRADIIASNLRFCENAIAMIQVQISNKEHRQNSTEVNN